MAFQSISLVWSLPKPIVNVPPLAPVGRVIVWTALVAEPPTVVVAMARLKIFARPAWISAAVAIGSMAPPLPDTTLIGVVAGPLLPYWSEKVSPAATEARMSCADEA